MGLHVGFGFSTLCDQKNEAILEDTSELQKLVYATAVTITALIPILISVQKLPTASIHELVLRDYNMVAFLTAGLTFGLPVNQEWSGRVVEAKDYLENNITWNPRPPRTRWSKYMFNSIFVVLQLSIIVLPTAIGHSKLKSQFRILWACHDDAPVVWHVGFYLPILVVAIVWCCFLRGTHCTAGDAKTMGQPIAYCRRHYLEHLDPFAKQLPGLAQMLMTVYFTFLFSTIYGMSVKEALLFVIMATILLFLSRGVSLWFAEEAMRRHPKLLVSCEDEDEVNEVLEHWDKQQNPDQQSLQRPPSGRKQLSRPPSP